MSETPIIQPDINTLPEGYLIHAENTYQIVGTEPLGVGHTSVVYQALMVNKQLKVALKLLKPESAQITKDNFWTEGTVLGELRNAKVSHLVPELIENALVSQEGWGFIALEFIDRGEFPSLDDLVEKETFPESEALEVVTRSLELFRALHEKVGRTYTDMQFKNFMWNRERHELKVLDWNHVSLQKDYCDADILQNYGVATFEELAQRDLARLAAYLYRLLTGLGAVENGESRRSLQRRASKKWGEISEATRQLIQKGLNPDPSLRFASAEQFAATVKDVSDLLDKDFVNEKFRKLLSEGIKNKLEEAEGIQASFKSGKYLTLDINTIRTALTDLDRTKVVLDALRRASPQSENVLKPYQERLKSLIDETSGQWAIGNNYYQVGHYSKALEIWSSEAVQLGDLSSWRWISLASCGKEMGEERFEAFRPGLESVLRAMTDNAFTLAKDQFKHLFDGKTIPDQLLSFYNDLELGVSWDSAAALEAESQRNPLQGLEAAQALRKIEQTLTSIQPASYQQALRDENNWFLLEKRAQGCDERYKDRQKNEKEDVEAEKELRILSKSGVDPFLSRVLRDPANEKLFAKAEKLARLALTNKDQRELARKRMEQFALYCVPELRSRGSILLAQINFVDGTENALKQIEEKRWVDMYTTVRALPRVDRGLEIYKAFQKQLVDTFQIQVNDKNSLAADCLDKALVSLEGSTDQARLNLIEGIEAAQEARFQREVKSGEFLHNLEIRSAGLKSLEDFSTWSTQQLQELQIWRAKMEPDQVDNLITQIDSSLDAAKSQGFLDESEISDSPNSLAAKWRDEMISLKKGLVYDKFKYQTEKDLQQAISGICSLEQERIKLVIQNLPGLRNNLGVIKPLVPQEKSADFFMWEKNIGQKIEGAYSLGTAVQSKKLPELYLEAKKTYQAYVNAVVNSKGNAPDLEKVALAAFESFRSKAGMVIGESSLPAAEIVFPGLVDLWRGLDSQRFYFVKVQDTPPISPAPNTPAQNNKPKINWFIVAGTILVVLLLLLIEWWVKDPIVELFSNPTATQQIALSAVPSSTPTVKMTSIPTPTVTKQAAIDVVQPTEMPTEIVIVNTETPTPEPTQQVQLGIRPDNLRISDLYVTTNVSETIINQAIYQISIISDTNWIVSKTIDGGLTAVDNNTLIGWKLSNVRIGTTIHPLFPIIETNQVTFTAGVPITNSLSIQALNESGEAFSNPMTLSVPITTTDYITGTYKEFYISFVDQTKKLSFEINPQLKVELLGRYKVTEADANRLKQLNLNVDLEVNWVLVRIDNKIGWILCNYDSKYLKLNDKTFLNLPKIQLIP